MSYKTYYKLSSLVLVIVSFALVFLIVIPFVEAESETEEIKNSYENELKLQDELRMHRNLYLQVSNSVNPAIASEIKDTCKDVLVDIDSAIYAEDLSPEAEMVLRQKLNAVNSEIENSLNFSGYVNARNTGM